MSLLLVFGMDTFTDSEVGDGTADPARFAPARLDPSQWTSIASELGFSYVVLTVKHLDGFCLWPSRFTSYTIAASPYKGGAGDIVREFSDACRMSGVKFGFYLAPWDSHERTFGTDAYNYFFNNQLFELLTGYGDVGEVWFDGAKGDNSRNPVYNWDLFFMSVRHYQPGAVMAVSGPDIRWIGNEAGAGEETEWCSKPRVYSMQTSVGDGKVWYPAECDVSIRPGWFYHQSENDQIKSVDSLTHIYMTTVGRNSNLMLSVPPDKDGLISDADVSRLREWRHRLNQVFARDLFMNQSIVASSVRDNSADYAAANCLDGDRRTFWAAPPDTTRATLTITLTSSVELNAVRLEEAIEYGQRISGFTLYYYGPGGIWVPCFRGTTVGRSRIVTFAPVQTSAFRIVIDSALASPTMRIVKGYYSPYL